MTYTYFVLGILSLVLSGMWFGSICTDYYNKVKINFTQYAMTTLTFLTGISQFFMLYKIVCST
jgi:uncharacterized membrane protein YbjE (DUF340 family)